MRTTTIASSLRTNQYSLLSVDEVPDDYEFAAKVNDTVEPIHAIKPNTRSDGSQTGN